MTPQNLYSTISVLLMQRYKEDEIQQINAISRINNLTFPQSV